MSYIQNKEQLTNRIFVSPTAEGADFTTIEDAIAWFNANAVTPTEMIIDGGKYCLFS